MKDIHNHIPGASRQLLRHFGLSETGIHDSHTCKRIRSELLDGIQKRDMMALIGPYHCGKTWTMRTVKRKAPHNVIFVHVKAFEDKWIRIGSILTAIITDISKEAVRRDIETRSRQVTRLLGEVVVNEGKEVCLVIEDCHRLHVNTLATLKLMREEDFAGYAPLFSILMLGWPEFLGKLTNRGDITERMETIKLDAENGWFSEHERVEYLSNVFGDAITPATRKRIAAMYSKPGSMNYYVIQMMKKARTAGYDLIDDNVVTPTLKEVYDSLKEMHGNAVSYSKIAVIAGLGKSTVSLAIEEEPNTPATSKVEAAMQHLANELTTQTQMKEVS